MRPSIDVGPPAAPRGGPGKAAAAAAERLAAIERGNRLLLGRMAAILTAPPGAGGGASLGGRPTRGYAVRGEAPPPGGPARRPPGGPGSASAAREAARVTAANLALLGRLQAVKPVLSRAGWAADAAANAALVRRISEFPQPSPQLPQQRQ